MSDEEEPAVVEEKSAAEEEPAAPAPGAASSAETQKEMEKEAKHEKEVKKKAEKKEKAKLPPKSIDVRQYSKALVFYPLFFYSIIAWFIAHFGPQDPASPLAGLGGSHVSIPAEPWAGILGLIWIAIFFANMFTVAFNFPTAKFFGLFLILVIVVLVLVLLYVAGYIHITGASTFFDETLEIYMNSTFYSINAILLGVVLFFILLGARLKYLHIEENEIFIKTAMTGKEERYPTNSMKYSKEIPDVFEFLILGAGSMTFFLQGRDKPVLFTSIPMVNKIAAKIDLMGDFQQVSIARPPQ